MVYYCVSINFIHISIIYTFIARFDMLLDLIHCMSLPGPFLECFRLLVPNRSYLHLSGTTTFASSSSSSTLKHSRSAS